MFPPNSHQACHRKKDKYIHVCIEVLISMHCMCCYIKNIYIIEVDSLRNKNSKNCKCTSLWNLFKVWDKENTVIQPFKIFQKRIHLKFLLYLFPRVYTLLCIYFLYNICNTLGSQSQNNSVYICLFPVASPMMTIFENTAFLSTALARTRTPGTLLKHKLIQTIWYAATPPRLAYIQLCLSNSNFGKDIVTPWWWS